MNPMQIIEQNGQRVLTTHQLAEAFGTDSDRIQKNFHYNKDRYIQNKHFILLEGEELRAFKSNFSNSEVAANTNRLYLWAEKGAWMHAKSLNTDEAWVAYESLVDDYYEKKQQSLDVSQLSPELQMFNQTFQALAKMQLEQKQTQKQLASVNDKVEVIQDTLLKRDEDWRKSMNSLLNAAAYRLGGKYQDLRNDSYRTLEERARCNLNIRLGNLMDRLIESGATKTKINNTTRLDVIEADPRLKEIYSAIVKELSIGSMKVMS